MANSSFRIQAQVVTPHFESERRYIVLERELAARQLETARKRPWLWFKVTSLDVYTERDWKNYIKLLDHYNVELAKHHSEIRDGLVPIHLRAANNSSNGLTDVAIHVQVEDGTFRPKKKPPKRPARMDGAADKTLKHHWRLPSPGGFVRKHLRLGTKSLDVTFNRLAPYDNALVVHQVIYVDSSAKTRLHYKAAAKGHAELAAGMLRVPRVR